MTKHRSPRPKPTVHMWAKNKYLPGLTVTRTSRASAAILARDGWQYCTRKQAQRMQREQA